MYLVETTLMGEYVITESSDKARDLYSKSRFGCIEGEKVQLPLLDAFYLLEKKKILIKDKRKELTPPNNC